MKVGDYVNGYLIDYIDSERRYLKGRNYNQNLHFFADDIKSIVTKEQFKSMEYKVGE